MVLYKTGDRIYFEDSARNITGEWYPWSKAQFEKVSNTVLFLRLYKYNGKDYKHFVSGEYTAADIDDENGDSYGSTPEDVLNGLLNKTIIRGLNPSGVLTDVKVNIEQALLSADFMFEVARGNIAGWKMYSIPGKKDSLSATVLDDLTEIPSTVIVPSPGGIQLEVISTNVNDAAAGTGAQSIEIHYLDTNNNEQSETVVTNGTTAVVTSAEDIDFVQWMHAKTLGGNANGVALGNISLQGVSGGTVYEYIAANGNQSLSGRYKVPAAKVGYVVGWIASGITKKIDIRLRATVERYDRALLPGIFLFQDTMVLNNAPGPYRPFKIPKKMPALAQIKMSAISIPTGGDGAGGFDIVIIDD